jgi:aminopeptidase-like protein
MLWVLSQSDGKQSLLDIASKSKLGFAAVRSAAEDLAKAKLLRAAGEPRGRRAARRKGK